MSKFWSKLSTNTTMLMSLIKFVVKTVLIQVQKLYYYGSSKSTFLIDPDSQRRSSVRNDHDLTVDGQERSGSVRIGQERSGTITNGQERSKVVQSGAAWSRVVQIGPEWSKVVLSDHELSKVVQNGQEQSRFIGNGQDRSQILKNDKNINLNLFYLLKNISL